MNTTSTLVNNVSSVIQGVINGLAPLADKLGVAAQNLFGWAIQNNYAIAATDVVTLILALILLIPYLRFVKWGMEKENDSYSRFSNSDGLMFLGVGIGLVIGILALVGIINTIGDAIPRLIAPQYHALSDLIGMLK